jgi:hypothetical protein
MACLHTYSVEELIIILKASENPRIHGGGHTLERHVNISNTGLIRRVTRDTPDGGTANYGAFLQGHIQDAAAAAAALLNSSGGTFMLHDMDTVIAAVRARGRPLVPGDYPSRTLRGPVLGGFAMRWVQAGQSVVQVPFDIAEISVRGKRGGTIEIITCFPIFTGCRPGEMQTLYPA